MSDSKSPLSRMARHIQDVPRSGIRDFFDIVSNRKGVISLGIGEPDFDTPWHVREAAIYAQETGATHYTSNLGLLKLRQELSKYVENNYGCYYKPETEIIVTVGVSEALDLAVRALIDPGDEVLYHEPCYVSYAPVITFAHGVPVAVPTSHENGFRLTRAALEEKVTDKTKVLMLNYPNNPTGGTLDQNDLQDIAQFAIDHDLFVITDEIYAELTYEGEHHSMVAIPGMKERIIFLHGFSKAWAMTGFRMGYACSTPELTDAMMKIHQYIMLCATTPSQEAAIEALRDPSADIDPMRAAYRRRRNYICSVLRELDIPCHTPRGAFYVFPYIGSLGLSSYDFAMTFLNEENVAVVPGTAFGSCGEGYIRCSYATSMENIRTAMDALRRFVTKLRES